MPHMADGCGPIRYTPHSLTTRQVDALSTSTPHTLTTRQVDALFGFAPALGLDYTGVWTTNSTFTLTVVNATGNAVPPSSRILAVTCRLPIRDIKRTSLPSTCQTPGGEFAGNFGVLLSPELASATATAASDADGIMSPGDQITVKWSRGTDMTLEGSACGMAANSVALSGESLYSLIVLLRADQVKHATVLRCAYVVMRDHVGMRLWGHAPSITTVRSSSDPTPLFERFCSLDGADSCCAAALQVSALEAEFTGLWVDCRTLVLTITRAPPVPLHVASGLVVDLRSQGGLSGSGVRDPSSTSFASSGAVEVGCASREHGLLLILPTPVCGTSPPRPLTNPTACAAAVSLCRCVPCPSLSLPVLQHSHDSANVPASSAAHSVSWPARSSSLLSQPTPTTPTPSSLQGTR